MLATLDVDYDETTLSGTGAAVVFEHWEDAMPMAEYAAKCGGIQPYVQGQVFRRELRCLIAVLEKVREPLSVLVVDGYVTLGNEPLSQRNRSSDMAFQLAWLPLAI